MTTCGDYNILRKLGTGGFADVFLAKHMYSKQLVALKVMVRNDDFSTDFEQFIKDEISTMKELKHQGIINLIDYELKTIMRRGNQPGFEV